MFIDSNLTPQRAAGFSLVEIMVGMVIGMFGLLIMMQVFSLAEEQKRTTTSGGDTQSTGAIALYGLQRDIRQAGYAISDAKLIYCSITLRSAVAVSGLAPLTIDPPTTVVPAGDANTDTLLVAYGNTNGTPQGDGISSYATVPNVYNMQTASSFSIGDRVIAAPSTRAASCALTLDTVLNIGTGANSQQVSVTTGATGMYPGGTLFNLGQSPKVYAYAIRNGDLTQCNYMVNNCSVAADIGNTAIWVQVAGNIASLRAEYGQDTTGTADGYPDLYDQNLPATPTYCHFARVPVVRLALVARSANLERTVVTSAAPTWEGSTPHTTWAGANNTLLIDLSANANWQNYRYKVFQTVVPLRNIVWAGASSC